MSDREISLSVSRETVWEEVAKLTDYTGSKSDGGDDVRDRILSTDDDLKTLSGFWDEAMAIADDRLKAMYISGSGAGSSIYNVTLEVSVSFDKRLTVSVQTALRNFFINYIVGKWFILANKGESADYMVRADSMMEDVLRKLYSRKRPTRPVGKVGAVVILCFGLMGVLSGCSSRKALEPAIVTESRSTSFSDSLAQEITRLMVLMQTQRQSETTNQVERVRETTVLNERGDTTRHDTSTERSTTYILRLEQENMMLQREVDSLRNVRDRVDSVSVPVPYKVEVPVPVGRELTRWERGRINSWWWLAIGLMGCAGYIFRVPIARLARRFI